MIQNYALIKNSIVVNIIVADDDFIELIKNEYDSIIATNNLPVHPCIGWLYSNGEFTNPSATEIKSD